MGRHMVSFALLIVFLGTFLTALVHFRHLSNNAVSDDEDAAGFLIGELGPASITQDPKNFDKHLKIQAHQAHQAQERSRTSAELERLSGRQFTSRHVDGPTSSELDLAYREHHIKQHNHKIRPNAKQFTSHHVHDTVGSGHVRPKGEDLAIGENRVKEQIHRVKSGPVSSNIESEAVLFPAWEVLVVVSPDTHLVPRPGDNFQCHYPNKETSAAEFIGILPFSNSSAFRCAITARNHRRLPFPQPVLKRSTDSEPPISTWPELPRWSYMVYESFSTESDVVVFVKGVNNKQGFNRSPDDFRCVFGDDARSAVKTTVTSSVQEVFRCRHPNLTTEQRVKISLEIPGENRYIPSVAYYNPPRKIAPQNKKSLICACTMVYNSAKFLKEWVTYHSKIGVEKFILYDNGSSDNSDKVIGDLNEQGFHVEKVKWIWPKTQEAGFSHGAIYAKDSCVWMMYLDVDEFIYSPSWLNSSSSPENMLDSLLPSGDAESSSIGQVTIKCNEFGPSGKEMHPPEGLTQGYTCRRLEEHRHKSIIRLDAVDYSLLNMVHHFVLNSSLYQSLNLGLDVAVVNHYKYQAWPEFKNKFRRRVSAYVADWTQAVNLESQDRTPGLGFEAVEPPGWAQKFCEVTDDRLKQLTERLFGTPNQRPNNNIAWQK